MRRSDSQPDPPDTGPGPGTGLERIEPAEPPWRGGGMPAAAGSATPDALALMRALQRRWRWALAAGVAGALLAGGAAWTFTPRSKYVARATLLVATYRPKVIFETADQSADYRTFQKTQENLVRSRQVLKAALGRPEIERLPTIRAQQPDPMAWIEKELKIEFLGGSEVLQLTLAGDEPKDLSELVNAVMKAYLAKVNEIDRTRRLDRFEKLQKLYAAYLKEMEEKRAQLRHLADRMGTDDRETLVYKHQLELQRLALARQELAQLQGRLREARAEFQVQETRARALARRAVSREELDRRALADAKAQEYVAHSERLRQAVARAAGLSQRRGDLSVTGPAKALRDNEAQLAEHLRRLGEVMASEIRSESQAELDEAKRRLAVIQKQAEEVQAEIDGIRVETQKMGQEAMDLQTQQAELTLKEETTKKVGTEVHALDVEVQAAPRIIPMDWSEAPTTREPSKVVKVTAGATVGGFALAVLGVAFWEFRTRKITRIDEVVSGLGLRLMGSLPVSPTTTRRLLPGMGEKELRRSQEFLLESIDTTRTVLLHASRTEGIRVVMVTSASGGEGKTSLASHLATSLARAGRQTVLVDCDLRNPVLHRLFDTAVRPGVCELLRGEASLEEVTLQTFAPNLCLVPAGGFDESALDALARDGLSAAFASLKERFDFLIVDSAPVLPVADSLLVGQHADAVILSIRSEVSRVPNVLTTCERLGQLGIRLLGAVVVGGFGVPDKYYQSRSIAGPERR